MTYALRKKGSLHQSGTISWIGESGSVCPPSQFSHFSLPSDSSESAKGNITTWPKSFHWFQANVEIELTGTLFV